MPANKYSDSLLMDALRGSLSNAESFGRGFGVAPVGLLGDINALAREYITPRLPANVQGLLQSMPSAPTTERILSAIPRMTPRRMESSGMEQIGSAANPRGPLELAKGVGRVAGNAVNEAMVYGRGPLASITPQPMRMVDETNGLLSYRSSHKAPSPEFGAPLYDLTGGGQMYPADVYSAKATQYYGTGFPKADKEAFALANKVRGNPDAEVTMYRAVPKDEKITNINAGDWVTLSKDYAKMHGESVLGNDYKILSQKVKAKDLWTNADSIHEFGYQPQSIEKSSFQYPQEQALRTAQENAATLGQSANQETRMMQQGYYPEWYHGTTGDITNFRPDLLGETTGAQSAKKGFFFARDPQNPPASMMVKTTDQTSIDLLRKLGIPEEEIAKLNQVSMQGHGAETASGYAKIGGNREYKEAMRKANAAEKRGDWTEYEKQMQIAEDSEINRMNYAQDVVAKYGDARDQMLDTIQKTIYSKNLPQAEAEALDAKVKQLMPYGWYNSYSQPQLDALKKEIVNLVGEDAASPVLKQIDNFKSIKAERYLVEQSQEGGNVMPVALRYKNPMVYDFGGSAYRDQTYSDLVDQALRGGHDALIFKNTFDPASSPSKLIDVGVVFNPDQIRSRFAAFDPFRKDIATATAMGVALPDLLAAEYNQQPQSAGLLYPLP